ncbi:NAD+ synthase [Pyrobaculum islandicum]|uniref:NAD+ synthase n=1 Tax=Pyrobaculum islandicum TaxID=2277 RepID=UPI00069D1E18|nr:NAD+ synthase [Pyrobaculum islandicum]
MAYKKRRKIGLITIQDVVEAVDYSSAKSEITAFIHDYVSSSGAKGVVVGLSGGVDSSTALALAVEALGADRVVALVLPSRYTPQQDVEDAVSLAKQLGVRHFVVQIDQIVSAYSSLPFYDEGDQVARGNLMARVRMSILYYYANRYDMLVLGTGDKSELMLGYFTKYGDGGVDLLPIGDLYKTQVRRMAKHLGVPDRIAEKPSAPRLWAGHTAEGELGISYREVDLVLYAHELGLSKDVIPDATGVSRPKVEKVLALVAENAHKRAPPPVAKLTKSKRYTTRI